MLADESKRRKKKQGKTKIEIIDLSTAKQNWALCSAYLSQYSCKRYALSTHLCQLIFYQIELMSLFLFLVYEIY